MPECPLCRGQSELHASAQPAYRQGSVYEIYRCSQCGVGYAEPRREDDEIYEQIYRQSARVPGYRRYQRYARMVDRSRTPLEDLARSEDVYWGVVEALRKNQRSRKILEVGSGLGYLTAALARAGYDIRGVDVSQVAVEAATRRFGPLFIQSDLFEFAAANAGAYDAVIACELLEHLVDPARFLEAAIRLLGPSGELVLTTPNRSLFEADVAWETDPPPVHFWWFSERSLELLAYRIGAEVEFTDFTQYQDISPVYIPRRIPVNTITRESMLDAAGRLPARSGVLRDIRAVVGEAFPILRSNSTIQRIRGRRKVSGPRRTVMCAILRKRRPLTTKMY